MGNKHRKSRMRVAVLPVLMKGHKHGKKRRKKCMVYIVTGRAHGHWILPTGKLEKNLSTRRVAMLEAFEEAGVIGKLDDRFRIRILLQSPCGKKRETIVFLLYVTRILNHWPEERERKRKAVSVRKYARTVSNAKLRKKLLEM